MSHESKRPAFSAPLYAALRQGAKEFAQALPALPTSIRPVEEPGTLGNPTPQMVTEQQIGMSSEYSRLLDAYAREGEHREPPDRGMDR